MKLDMKWQSPHSVPISTPPSAPSGGCPPSRPQTGCTRVRLHPPVLESEGPCTNSITFPPPSPQPFIPAPASSFRLQTRMTSGRRGHVDLRQLLQGGGAPLGQGEGACPSCCGAASLLLSLPARSCHPPGDDRGPGKPLPPGGGLLFHHLRPAGGLPDLCRQERGGEDRDTDALRGRAVQCGHKKGPAVPGGKRHLPLRREG